ncbi:MAG: inositol monophosphatase family protein, partial [Planctomycetia bacterium]
MTRLNSPVGADAPGAASRDIPADARRVCEAAARAGGRVLLDWVGRFGVSNKGPRDLVTVADLASQREIRSIVLAAFPDHGFIGEESLPEHVGDGASAEHDPAARPVFRWMVDPLDGTSNYVHGFPAWCVSVALTRGDEILVGAIHDPKRDECFTAELGAGTWLNGEPVAASRCTKLSDALVALSFPPHLTADSVAVADFLAVAPQVHSVRGAQPKKVDAGADIVFAFDPAIDRPVPRLEAAPAAVAEPIATAATDALLSAAAAARQAEAAALVLFGRILDPQRASPAQAALVRSLITGLAAQGCRTVWMAADAHACADAARMLGEPAGLVFVTPAAP